MIIVPLMMAVMDARVRNKRRQLFPKRYIAASQSAEAYCKTAAALPWQLHKEQSTKTVTHATLLFGFMPCLFPSSLCLVCVINGSHPALPYRRHHWWTSSTGMTSSSPPQFTSIQSKFNIGSMADWLIDWLIDWLVDWLIGWLIGWLIDWFID